MILWPDGRYLSEQQVRALGPATGDDWGRLDLADAAQVYAGAGWLPDRLAHVYGPERAAAWLPGLTSGPPHSCS